MSENGEALRIDEVKPTDILDFFRAYPPKQLREMALSHELVAELSPYALHCAWLVCTERLLELEEQLRNVDRS